MAYSKENKYKRIIDVQTVFKREYKPGMSIKYIFDTVIYPQFKISRKTFDLWMKINPKKELEKIENDKQNKNKFKQLAMDFAR